MKRIRICIAVALLAAAPLAGWAGFFDELQKLADPTSKESKILSGAKQVLSSSQEVDLATEQTIGETLALEGLQRYGKPLDNETLQRYVNQVGTAVAKNSQRATIPYRFAVLDSPLQNAFACPGGVIFISRALFELLDNEAELAAILAHEVGHVAGKHALKSTRRAQFLQGVGTITTATMKGDSGQQYEALIGDLQSVLFDKGLDKSMEYEADLAALDTTYRTGYDPAALVSVLAKLQQLEADSEKTGSWFSTHPPLKQRIARLNERLAAYPDRASMAKLPERFKKMTKR